MHLHHLSTGYAAHLAELGKEVCGQGDAGRRLGFDVVNGGGVWYHLYEGSAIRGHQHLIGSQGQRQLCFLHIAQNRVMGCLEAANPCNSKTQTAT